jgi:ketosteroid isomerase-like protein
MKNILLFILISMLVFYCTSSKIDQQAEAKKIMSMSREWAKIAATDSLDKLLSFWADDAVCLFPDQGPVRGKEAIKEMLIKSASPGFEISWEPKEAHVSPSGDMAYVIAQNYIKKADTSGNIITTFNKSIEIWRRQKDGAWKCVVDMYNSDPTIKSIKE